MNSRRSDPVGSTPLAPDHDERSRALDPTQSFIVQAPAGSGKTGLLIQRYLKLLACVGEPEEIVAITFTRKAAAEMRARLTSALRTAAERITPETAGENTGDRRQPERENQHEKVTRELAEAVLRRDKQAGWDMVTNPARLRIQTFDSLCASLTRQMPVLSKFGSQPEVIEDASDLYLEAARTTIGLVEGEEAVSHDVQCLLEHLDNDVSRIEMLLVDMLARRDHWLRHIHGRERDELEAGLRSVRRDALQRLLVLFPATMRDELAALLRYTAGNLADGKKEDEAHCGELTAFDALPDSGEQGIAHWLATTDLLLTKEGTWRKQHIARDGFPAGNKFGKEIARSWKDRATALISLLAANDDGTLRQALHDIRFLPPPSYTERQWQVLGAITRLLPRAVAELRLVFQSQNKVDFTEMAQGALRALGEPEMPTDLALALDYSIQHLLIDEFQDTSISQYELITKLTTGWEWGDGRSILVVGDPMQSIYRFREAEVGLFLRARAAGFGNVTLHPISLSANFRSQRGIVDWVNSAFARLMPSRENISMGAVAYSPSVAMSSLLDGAAVSVHPFFNGDQVAEAEKAVEIAAQMRRYEPSSTTAILVRNRNHLDEIIPRLKEAGLRFRAVDIEGLGRQAVVQDLLVLTRALVHPADRAAWLALLRAPWCGLTLADIHVLASTLTETAADVDEGMDTNAEQGAGGVRGGVSNKATHRTVWESLLDEACMESLSDDGRARLLRIRGVLKECMANRSRSSLRETVEAAWVALGGPACAEDATSLEDASAYLDYLESKEDAGSIASLAALEGGLDGLFALPDLKADDTLQIMTMHKAKGLEFDCVIVPGLGRSPRRNDKKLFMWTEYLRDGESGQSGDGNELLLAPIEETGTEGDRIYSWLEKLDAEKEHLEAGRLLYVAATRARKRLHLLGSTGLVGDGEGKFELKPPGEKTLLGKVWPVLEPFYSTAAVHHSTVRHTAAEAVSSDSSMRLDDQEPGTSGEYTIDQSLRRLVSGWVMPPPPPALHWEPRQRIVPVEGAIEYSWAGETARIIGNIVHRWLQRIALDGMAGWDATRVHRLRETLRRQLMGYGMFNGGSDINAAIQRVTMALAHAVSEPRGRWLLEPRKDARSELRITGIVEGEYRDLVIDRTFCDTNGQRWVVDYKTSSHEGADVERFLDREQERYRAQLDRYASLMRAVDERPVRRGLYFPLLKGWREWGDET